MTAYDKPHQPIIDRIREIAKSLGWAIGVHGSLRRDIDLIAVPWVEGACCDNDLVDGIISGTGYHTFGHRLGKPRPSGRRTILLFAQGVERVETPECTKGTWNPPCVDLSIVESRPEFAVKWVGT